MAQTLGKAALAKMFDDKLGLWNSNASYLLVLELLGFIGEVLAKHEKLTMSKFGVFYVLKKKARKGRNPKTGERITLPPRLVVKFRPSAIFKSICNC